MPKPVLSHIDAITTDTRARTGEVIQFSQEGFRQWGEDGNTLGELGVRRGAGLVAQLVELRDQVVPAAVTRGGGVC